MSDTILLAISILQTGVSIWSRCKSNR